MDCRNSAPGHDSELYEFYHYGAHFVAHIIGQAQHASALHECARRGARHVPTPLLRRLSLRGELSTFNTAAFVPRLAQLLGVQPAEIEVLAITPAHASRYAQQAALTASRAAAQALALVPEGLPSELTSKLRAIEHDANDAAAIAQGRQAGTLALRISAVVPRASAQADAASLHADLPALSSALGAEVLGPIAFEMSALS